MVKEVLTLKEIKDRNDPRSLRPLAKQLKTFILHILDHLSKIPNNQLREQLHEIFSIFSFPKRKKIKDLRLDSQQPLGYLYLVVLFFAAYLCDRTPILKMFLQDWIQWVKPNSEDSNLKEFMDRIQDMLKVNDSARPGEYLPQLVKFAYGRYRSVKHVETALQKLPNMVTQRRDGCKTLDDLIALGKGYRGYATCQQVIQKLRQCANKQRWGQPLLQPQQIPVEQLQPQSIMQAEEEEEEQEEQQEQEEQEEQAERTVVASEAINLENENQPENNIFTFIQRKTEQTLVQEAEQLRADLKIFQGEDSDPHNCSEYLRMKDEYDDMY